MRHPTTPARRSRPRIRGGRPWAVLALVVLAAGMLGLVPAPSAVASCVGPVLAVGVEVDDARPPATGALPAPGEDAVVSGSWFHNGCDDTGQGTGCSAPPSTESPMEDVVLALEQGGKVWSLGTADAASRGERYAIGWRVAVPSEAQPGEALLRAGSSTLPVTIGG